MRYRWRFTALAASREKLKGRIQAQKADDSVKRFLSGVIDLSEEVIPESPMLMNTSGEVELNEGAVTIRISFFSRSNIDEKVIE